MTNLLSFLKSNWDTKVKPFIKLDDNECWRWQRGKNVYGYGRVCLTRTNVLYTHIASYMYHHETLIPPGICVLHKCDVRDCLNPDHLFLGTKTDNANDKTSKGRARGVQSLNTADLTEIRRLLAQGVTHTEIAAKLRTSIATISRVRNDKCNYYTKSR